MAKKNTGIFTRKAMGLIIGLVGIFLLVFIVFYTISRVFRPQDLATMLPKDRVVALTQMSVNEHHEQVQRFYEELNKYDVYHPNNMHVILNSLFNTDVTQEVYPWLDRQIGAAVLQQGDGQGATDLVLFFETNDQAKTLSFLESRGLQTQDDYLLSEAYEGVDIYRYALSQTYNFMFLNNYLIVADNEAVLQSIVDADDTYKKQLIADDLYQKVSQNLPVNYLMFGYADIGRAREVLKQNETFMSQKGKELLAFEPFLKLYKACGVTAVMENGNVALQTFTALDQDYLAGKDFIDFETKYRANLLDYVPSDVVFFAGGFDLQKQMHRYADIMSAGGDVSYLIFEGMLRAKKNEYIGEEIDLEEDIYPLLQGEYGMAINQSEGYEATTILIELADPLKDKEIIESIIDSFIRKSAILAPTVVEVELEDGTTMEEIQTVPEEIVRSTEDYHGYEINVLTVGTQPWGIYYIIVDDVFIATSQKEQMHASIDLVMNRGNSVKQSDIYRESIAPVVRTTDEVLYVDFTYMIEKLGGMPDYLTSYAEPFDSVGSGTNYFKDGISSIHYIKIN